MIILLMLLFYKTNKEGRSYMNEVLNAIKNRRSVRTYLPTQIKQKDLDLIIESGIKNALSPKVDCSAAIQNMLLAAESLHIGSVWIGLITFFLKLENEVKNLGIPDGYEPYYGVALGYKSLNKEMVAPKRNLNVVNYIR